MINKLLRLFGYQIIKSSSTAIEVNADVLAMTKVAWLSCMALEGMEHIKNGMGEYKRHQVYAQMLKKYDKAEKSDVAIAIELAVKRMKGDGTWL